VALATGSHKLAPDTASLEIRTYREGMAARVGHDLVLDVTRWEATVEIAADPAGSTVELSADSRSLEVREGLRGLKPLTDKDRAEIRRNIDEKVLGGQPITFRSRAVRLVDGDARLVVEGDLTISGTTRPISARFDIDAEGVLSATIPLTQSSWGIKPYRGLMGALKVRDDLEIAIAARLPVR
jgi:polyisoprenoid-binding protein YceI